MPRKSKAKKASLFEGSEESGAGISLSINSRYATTFEDRKRKADLERATELGLLPRGGAAGGDEAEESEESEDEGEQLDPALDRQITDIITAIRRKDPKVYDTSITFFEEAPAAAASSAAGAAKGDKAKKRGKSAQEVVAGQLVEAAEAGREDAFEEDEELLGPHGKRAVDDGNRSANARLYNAEQRELRDAFLASAGAAAGAQQGSQGAGAEAEAEEEEEEGLLRVKPKSKKQRAAEEEEARVTREELLKSMASRKGAAAAHADEIVDPEKFLTAFMQSSVWRDAEREEEELSEAEQGEASEEELEKAEEFEAVYNFRFEDPAGAAIVTHARGAGMDTSLRRVSTKRKEEREKRKEREERLQGEAAEETRRLMNLKRAELKGKLGKIKDIVKGSGLRKAQLKAVLGTGHLDSDWDPEEHDKRMAELFGDEFYGQGEEGEEEVAAAAAAWVYGDGPRPQWAGPSGEELAEGVEDGLGEAPEEGGWSGRGGSGGGGGDWEEEEGGEEGEEGEEEEEDAAVVGIKRARKAGRRKDKRGRKGTALARAREFVAREKAAEAAAAAAGGGRAGRAVLGREDDPPEVLELGYEDIIAGGLRTKFKYTPVAAETYGLSSLELLMADDADLAQLVPLRHLAPYRELEAGRGGSKKGRRRVLETIKAKVTQSLEELHVDKPNVAGGKSWRKGQAAAVEEEVEEQQQQQQQQQQPEEAEGGGEAAEPAAGEEKKRRRKRRKGGQGEGAEVAEEVEPEGASAAAAAASVEGGEEAAAAAAAKALRKAKKEERRRKEGAQGASGEEVVTLATGGKVTKSRLSSYGF